MSIEKNSLRIGNLVYPNDENATPWKVLELRHDGALFYYADQSIRREEGVISYEGLEPIELSTDILLKCGFVHDGDFYSIELGNNSFIRAGSTAAWVDKLVDEEYISVGLFGAENLHTLMNLYYSLTGKELNCNL